MMLLCAGCKSEPITYTVSFDSDGGSEVSAQIIIEGQKAAEPIAPTKDGYTFDGWYFGKDAWRFSLDSITSDVSLKAKWTPIQYKAEFYADGALVDSVNFTCEDSTLSKIPAIPNKNGYSSEWSDITLGLQDITVNAVYTKITYNITYNGADDITHSNPLTYDVETDTITLTSLSKAGKVFYGWYDESGTQVTTIPKGSYGDLVLTARWSDKVTVTFNSDGGTTIAPQILDPNSKVLSPDAPTKLGYNFDGWYYNGEPWRFNTDTVTSNITLRAKWTPKEYSAKFYASGTLVDTVKFTVEDNVLSRLPQVPNKNGYNGVWSSFSLGMNDIRVDAVYTIITYTITYNNLNGAVNTNPLTYTVETPTITLSDITQSGSVFRGWLDANGNTIVTIPKGTFGNLNITAKWEGMLNVIFDSNGGSSVTSQMLEPGSKATKPDDPTKTGYEFAGWYNGNEPWSFGGNIVTTDITLKAKWTPIEYSACFYADGNLVDTVLFTIEDSELPRIPNVPNKNGYKGVWSTYTLALNNIEVNAIYSIITYTATFKVDGVTITVDEFNVENFSVTIPSIPEKAGYTATWEPYTLSTQNIIVNAIYTPIAYTITYNNIENATNNNPSYYTIEDQVITLIAPIMPGCTFAGWIDESGNQVVEIVTNNLVNITLTAQWSVYNLSTITTIDNSGDYTKFANKSITAGEKVTLTATPYLGYIFEGWYNDSGLLSNTPTYTFTMPQSNITYIAKFKVAPELDGYTFTSTSTTCVITGVTFDTADVTELKIPNYVTEIQGSYHFPALEKLIIENKTKELRNFSINAPKLTAITLPDVPLHVGNFSSTGYYLDENNWENGVLYIGKHLIATNSSLPEEYEIKAGTLSIACSAFANNTNIKKIIMPSSLKDAGENAFWYCTNLESVELSALNHIRGATFAYCTSLKSIIIPEGTTSITSGAFSNCTSLEYVSIPSSCTKIKADAFKYCINLKTILLPTSITEIGNYAFSHCSSLKTIHLANSLTKIGICAFSDCLCLETIYYQGTVYQWESISKGNSWDYNTGAYVIEYTLQPGLNYTLIDNKYYSVKYVEKSVETTVIIPSTYNGLPVKVIEDNAFYNCTNITSISLPDSITHIGVSAFNNCTNLVNINIPESVIKIGEYAFYNCTKIKHIKLSAIPHIQGRTFMNCTSLESIEITEGVTAVTSFAFQGCTSLKNIILPSTCDLIRLKTFQGCTSLESITILGEITEISSQAFEGCINLKNIYYYGTENEWNAIYKGDEWDLNTGNYTITYNYTKE